MNETIKTTWNDKPVLVEYKAGDNWLELVKVNGKYMDLPNGMKQALMMKVMEEIKT